MKFPLNIPKRIHCVCVASISGWLLACHPAAAKEVRVACQNNTGDATLINNAIAGSASGDEIVITGTGLINQTIKLNGGRTYRGDTLAGTVLRQASGANLVAVMASDSFVNNSSTTGNPIAIRHLTVDGNKSANTGTTIGIIVRSWLSTVEDVQVQQMDGDGICLSSPSANGTMLTNTQVNGRIADCIVKDCSGNGIYVKDSGGGITDWALVHNTVQNSGANGINLENGAGWYVVDNLVQNSSRSGISVSRAFASSISHNQVDGFGTTSTQGTYSGISATLQGSVGAVIVANTVSNTTSAGNSGSTRRYIAIPQVNYGAGYASVVNNTVTHGSSATGISIGLYYFMGGGASLKVASSGNTVTGVGTIRSSGSSVVVDTGL